jgi:hypothetical protein
VERSKDRSCLHTIVHLLWARFWAELSLGRLLKNRKETMLRNRHFFLFISTRKTRP